MKKVKEIHKTSKEPSGEGIRVERRIISKK